MAGANTTLAGQMQLFITGTLTQSPPGLSSSRSTQQLTASVSVNNGTGAYAGSNMYFGVVQLAPSANTTLALNNASLQNALNQTINTTGVVGIGFALLNAQQSQNGISGTNCTSCTWSGLNGSQGFQDGTSPKRRVWSGGFDAACNPSAAGVTNNLQVTIVNEDGANAAVLLVGVETK